MMKKINTFKYRLLMLSLLLSSIFACSFKDSTAKIEKLPFSVNDVGSFGGGTGIKNKTALTVDFFCGLRSGTKCYTETIQGCREEMTKSYNECFQKMNKPLSDYDGLPGATNRSELINCAGKLFESSKSTRVANKVGCAEYKIEKDENIEPIEFNIEEQTLFKEIIKIKCKNGMKGFTEESLKKITNDIGGNSKNFRFPQINIKVNEQGIMPSCVGDITVLHNKNTFKISISK